MPTSPPPRAATRFFRSPIAGISLMSATQWDFAWRRVIEGVQLTLVESGGCEWRAGRYSARRTPDSVAIVASGELAIGTRIFGPSDFFQVEVDAELATFRRSDQRNEAVTVGQLRNISRAVRSNAEDIAVETAIVELLGTIRNEAPSRVPARHAPHVAASRMREVLHARFAAQLSLSELAKEAGVSPFHGLRLFREAYGVPPFQYLVHLRLQRARAALFEGRPAVDVANATGFADQAHLSRWFRRMFQTTPTAFARASRASRSPRRVE